MRFSKRVFATTLAAALVAAAAVTFSVDFGAAGAVERYTPRLHGNMTLAQAQAFAPFDLYYPGPSTAGLPLVAINRVAALHTNEPGFQVDRVSFLYGQCSARRGEGCMPPLQLQVWNGCERYQGLYPFEPDEAVQVRGVPAAFYEEKTRLEIYTGMVTVVLFGQNRQQLLTVAGSLRGLNRATTPSESLSDPAQGVRTGTLDCQQ